MEPINTLLNYIGHKRDLMVYFNRALFKTSGLRDFDLAIDPFLGSGQGLLNLSGTYKLRQGNDLFPLGPRYLRALFDMSSSSCISVSDLEDLLSGFRNITDKSDYYHMRDWWNTLYRDGSSNLSFVIGTVLLLKMCSSMVRFNTSGEFNQGFRGIHPGDHQFFSDDRLRRIASDLNSLVSSLKNLSGYTLLSEGYDFSDFIESTLMPGKSAVVILDPPYIPNQRVYGTMWSSSDQDRVYSEFLRLVDRERTFVGLFAYLGVHPGIDNLADKFGYTLLNTSTGTGQSRTYSQKSTREVLICSGWIP